MRAVLGAVAALVLAAPVWAAPGDVLTSCGGQDGQVSEMCLILCEGGSCVSDYFDLGGRFGSGRNAQKINARGREFSLRLANDLTAGACNPGSNLVVSDSVVSGGQKAIVATLEAAGPPAPTAVVAVTERRVLDRFVSVDASAVAGCTTPPTLVLMLKRYPRPAN